MKFKFKFKIGRISVPVISMAAMTAIMLKIAVLVSIGVFDALQSGRELNMDKVWMYSGYVVILLIVSAFVAFKDIPSQYKKDNDI